MKYLLLVVVMISFSSCMKHEYYQCTCKLKGVDTASLDFLDIGATTKDNAYARCRAFRDTSAYNCNMTIFK